jgi:hypothetical protein
MQKKGIGGRGAVVRYAAYRIRCAIGYAIMYVAGVIGYAGICCRVRAIG